MKKEAFAEILKINALKLTRSEIEAVMNEELGKPPELIDAELIDLCIEALEGKSAEIKGDNLRSINKKFTIKKALFIAAIISILLICSVSISADVINIDTSNRNVVYDEGKLEEGYHYDEAKEVLEKYDIEDIPFPQEFLLEEYELKYEEESDKLRINIKSEKNDVEGGIWIQSITSKEDSTSKFDTSFKNAEEIKIGEISVFIVTSHDKDVIVKYIYGDLECRLYLYDCSYDKALNILKSIK